MTYQWKIPVVPVDAQVAGNEFERLYKENGRLAPKDVVDASRDENAPLHGCFEWNDSIAAEKYRENQAGNIIRCLVKIEQKDKQSEPIQARAFVHVQQEYHPIEVVVKCTDMYAELMANAERDMNAFTQKYDMLTQLKPVITVMKAYTERKNDLRAQA